jgi:hypothetical protein
VAGRSCKTTEPGVFSFEATVDGEPVELRVTEHVAFDFLRAWTIDREKCFDILRLHRRELARSLERKLEGSHEPLARSYLLDWRDVSALFPADVESAA